MKPNYCSDEYFFETAAEDRSIVDAITEIAKGLAKKELTRELESMAEKIDALSEELDYYKNFKEEKFKLEQEINRLKYENNLQYSKGYEAAKSEKLLKFLHMQKGYSISHTDEYVSEKCDKCDDERYIHFKSPSGRDFTEKCSCAKTKRIYHIENIETTSIIFKNGEFYRAYFNKPISYGVTGEREELEFCRNKIYVSDKFYSVDDLIKNKYRYCDVVFEKEADAQKYIDWLNSKEEQE